MVVGRGVVKAALRAGRPLVATNHFMPENLSAHSPIPRRAAAAAPRAGLEGPRPGLRPGRRGHRTDPARGGAAGAAAGLPDAFPVSCGIDAERYRDRPAGRPAPLPTVLFVGRLDQEKRVDELIRAFAALPAGLPAQLEIVGDGARRADWTALAAGLGIADRVRFRGFVVRGRAARRPTAGPRCSACPASPSCRASPRWRRWPPARPVVAADAMALPHLVRPGRNGWLYRPGDVAELSARLRALLLRRRAAQADGRGQPGAGRRARLRRHPGHLRGHLPAGAGPRAPGPPRRLTRRPRPPRRVPHGRRSLRRT